MRIKKRLQSLLLLSSIIFGIITLLFTSDHLWINTSESIPKGLYRLSGESISKDSYILFCLDDKHSQFALKRGYLHTGKCENGSSPIGKKVIGQRGDHVSIDESGIWINGIYISKSSPLRHDLKDRRLDYEVLDIHLLDGEYIVASEYENSYDSRYFGIIRKEQVIGTIKRIA
ncbi:MAG: conjugative transfer signal peptidase TraF [Succinivibrio sp.]